MGPHGRAPLLRATWLAALGAIYVLLTVSPAVRVASPLERVVFAPAVWLMRLLSERHHLLYEGLFPLLAALQLLLLGLLVDAPRILRGLRGGRPNLAPGADPLWAWKATLALALAGVAGAYFVNRHAEAPFFGLDTELQVKGGRERGELLAAQLKEAREETRDVRRVVLIGDSMAGAALVGNQVLEAGLRKDGRRPVDVVRLVAGGLELVQVRPFVDELLALEPTLVVLDANILFTKVGNVFLLHHYGRAARWANAALDRLEQATRDLGFLPGEHAQYAPADLPANVGEAAPADEAEARDRWAGRQASVHDPNFVFAGELLEELRRRGVPACLTTVPVSVALRPHVEDFIDQARALAADLARRADVPFVQGDRFAPDEWYVDTVHMNDAGKPEYSAWFVRHLPPLRD